MSKKTEQEEIKVILVGEAGTGKTSLINTSIGMEFKDFLPSSATNSFAPKEIKIDGKKYILNLWDTIGQEQFRSLTKIFIKDSKIVIFVYDITNYKSFEEVDFWLNTVKEILGDTAIFGLAGNKKDLFQNEKVIEEEGEKKAADNGAIFKLTSAKTGAGINDFMQSLLEKYVQKYKIKDNNDDKEDRGQRLDSSFHTLYNKKKSKCC